MFHYDDKYVSVFGRILSLDVLLSGFLTLYMISLFFSSFLGPGIYISAFCKVDDTCTMVTWSWYGICDLSTDMEYVISPRLYPRYFSSSPGWSEEMMNQCSDHLISLNHLRTASSLMPFKRNQILGLVIKFIDLSRVLDKRTKHWPLWQSYVFKPLERKGTTINLPPSTTAEENPMHQNENSTATHEMLMEN